MLKYFFNKMLESMKSRYGYDVRYMQDILDTDVVAYLKFMGFQTMSVHQGNLPDRAIFAARLRAIIHEDCGPCTQLIADMASEANVSPEIVQAIVTRDIEGLPEEVALVVEFTDLVLSHNPEADRLREGILALWGMKGLIAITYGISSSRVYPTMKYALGYGHSCHKVQIDGGSFVPKSSAG